MIFQGIESERRILDVAGDDILSLDTGPVASTNGAKSKVCGQKRVQSQLLAEMLALDRERGLTWIQSWATFVRLSASRRRCQPFASLEEYVPYRIIDAGEM